MQTGLLTYDFFEYTLKFNLFFGFLEKNPHFHPQLIYSKNVQTFAVRLFIFPSLLFRCVYHPFKSLFLYLHNNKYGVNIL